MFPPNVQHVYARLPDTSQRFGAVSVTHSENSDADDSVCGLGGSVVPRSFCCAESYESTYNIPPYAAPEPCLEPPPGMPGYECVNSHQQGSSEEIERF